MFGNYSSHIRDVDKLLWCSILSQQWHKVRIVAKRELPLTGLISFVSSPQNLMASLSDHLPLTLL